MKWKRAQPGQYTSGDLTVEGEGTKWTLYLGEEEIGKAKSKKELQNLAEETESEEKAPKPRKKPGKVIKQNPTVDDLPEVVEVSKGTVSLDCALRSIRLSIERLAESNSLLAKALMQLAESNELKRHK